MSDEPDLRTRWFGPEAWNSGQCLPELRIEMPNTYCVWCKEGFIHEDRGVSMPMPAYVVRAAFSEVLSTDTVHAPFHLECLIRQIVGSVGHQMGACGCKSGQCNPDAEGDPEALTTRQAARAAHQLWTRMQRQAEKPTRDRPKQ